jgi:hypothetical protein
MTVSEEKSELAIALEKRAQNRPTQLVEGMAFTGPGSTVIGSLLLRVATKQEENTAIMRAEVYCRDLAKKGGLESLKDPSIIEAARTVFILFEVCRDPKHNKSAFGSPSQMMETLTCDEIGKLLDLYNRWRAAQSPFDADLTPEHVEEVAAQLAAASGTDLADMLVQSKDRIWLEQTVIRLSMLLANRNEELSVYRSMEAIDGT